MTASRNGANKRAEITYFLVKKLPNFVGLFVDFVILDGQTGFRKNFFKDIQISFYWVTGIGLKSTQFFSF